MFQSLINYKSTETISAFGAEICLRPVLRVGGWCSWCRLIGGRLRSRHTSAPTTSASAPLYSYNAVLLHTYAPLITYVRSFSFCVGFCLFGGGDCNTELFVAVATVTEQEERHRTRVGMGEYGAETYFTPEAEIVSG